MKCVNGIWYYRGRSYATLYETLVAVWPRVLPRRAGEKEAAPGTANTGSGRVKEVFPTAYFTSEDTTETEVLQG